MLSSIHHGVFQCIFWSWDENVFFRGCYRVVCAMKKDLFASSQSIPKGIRNYKIVEYNVWCCNAPQYAVISIYITHDLMYVDDVSPRWYKPHLPLPTPVINMFHLAHQSQLLQHWRHGFQKNYALVDIVWKFIGWKPTCLTVLYVQQGLDAEMGTWLQDRTWEYDYIYTIYGIHSTIINVYGGVALGWFYIWPYIWE